MDIQRHLIAEYDQEIEKTRRLLAAIPADADFAFRPSPRSMPLGRLAGHTAETLGEWALHALTADQLAFPADHRFEPYIPASTAALLERLDGETAKARAELAGFDPERWERSWKFQVGDQVWIDDSKYNVWRTYVINHAVHHRAQLGVYLRVLGAKLPGMYGPSADEM
jgi:uncharacterized damage-inducible protein DinB